MVNLFSQKALFAADLHACIFAVREGFPHLTARDIIDPPHQWFDAALARQVAMHLMVRVFEWPKRRVVEEECRSREAINRALRTIDRRMETPRFAAHYHHMAAIARASVNIRKSDSRAA